MTKGDTQRRLYGIWPWVICRVKLKTIKLFEEEDKGQDQARDQSSNYPYSDGLLTGMSRF